VPLYAADLSSCQSLFPGFAQRGEGVEDHIPKPPFFGPNTIGPTTAAS
jgi:hypothetical protein